jgi:superfamily II DNA helicase RecQ
MHHSGKDTQIVIATATLSVGIDIPGIQDVLIVGTPDMLEDLVQEFGRGGRGKDDCGTRGILYYSKSNLKNANEVVARAAVAHSSGKDIEAPSNSSNLGTHDTHMSLSMAQVLCGTSCIVDEVDLTCKSGPKPPLAVPCKKRSTILMCEGSRAILAPSSVS